ncbi:hypothetical protein pb186bvf_018928 [Paramecium bursaria]
MFCKNSSEIRINERLKLPTQINSMKYIIFSIICIIIH